MCAVHQKLIFILQVWTRLLKAANAYQGAEIYRSHLTKQFLDRAGKVKSLMLLLVLSLTPLKTFFSLRLGLNLDLRCGRVPSSVFFEEQNKLTKLLDLLTFKQMV